MEFIRKAYDTLGSEISKTFDSSKDQPDSDASLKPGTTSHDPDWGDTPNKSKKTDEEESWGEWGDTSTGPKKPQIVTEGKGLGKTPPGPARGDPSSSDGSDAGERGGSNKLHVPWSSEAAVPLHQDVRGNTEGSPQQLPVGGGGGEASSAAPLATSTPAKTAGKSQLESLSKEELVKYVKKQAQLLQKTKSRCDELTKECEQLKVSSVGQPSSLQGSEALLGELQVLKVERDAAVVEVKGLRQTSSGLEEEKKHLSSQLFSIREEYDLLRQSFRQFQDDTASREEDLRCQLEASHTRLSAITEQTRDKEKELQGEIGVLTKQLNQLAASNRELEAKLCAIGDERRGEEGTGHRRGEEGTDSAEGQGKQDLKDTISELATTKEELSLLKARCSQLEASELRLSEEKASLGEELGLLRKQVDASVEDARQRLAEVEAERDKVSVEAGHLREEAKALLLSKEGCEQRVAALTREKNEVEADLGRRLIVATATIAKEQETRELLAAELADARSGMEQLQRSSSSVGEQLRAACVEKESLQRCCEDLRLELAALNQRAQKWEEEALVMGRTRETILQEKQCLEEALREEKRSAGVQREHLRSELEGSLGLQLKAAIEEKEVAVKERDGAARDKGALESRLMELEGALQRRGLEMEAAREASERAVADLESRLRVQGLAFESLKVERDSLQTSRDTLESSVGSRHQREVEGYLVKLQQLEQESGLVQDAKAQLTSELERLRSSGQETEERLVAAEKSNNELQLELEKMQEQCAKSAETLKTLGAVQAREEVVLDEEQDVLQKEEHKKLKMFVVKLKKELSEAKSKEATLKQQLEVVEGSPDLQGEVKALRAQLLEEQDRTAATKSQVDTLQRELEEERTKMSQERQRMTEECQAQTKTAEGLVRELEAAKNELTSLHAKQADIHSTTTQLTAEKENLVATLRQLTDSRDLLQSEVNALQSNLRVQGLAFESLKVERDSLQTSRDTLESSVGSKHQREVEGYLVKVQQLEQERGLVQDAKAHLTSELERLRSIGQETEERLVAAEKSNNELQLELEKMREQCAKSAETLKTLEEQDVLQKEEHKKLKMFVVKLKKELSEAKSKEATLKQQLEVVEGSPDLQGEVKALRAQLLEEQDRTAAAKSQVDTLEEERTKMSQERQRMAEECQAQTKTAEGLVRELEAAKSELTSQHAKQADIHSTTTQLTAEKENLVATLRQLTDSRDLLQSEVNALQSDLSTVVSEKATYKLATEAAQKEVTSLREELAKERTSHVETKEKLTAVEREAKASNVMDLELADYRRSVEQLRSQLSDRDSKIEAAKREKEEYQKTLEQLKKEMETVKQRSSKQEENLKKISSVVKTRNKELEDAKKQEGELQATIVQVQTELETQKQLAEGAKVEVADLTARLLSTQQQSQASTDVLQKMVNGLEAKVTSLQGELRSTQASLQTTQQEYDSYKVRVHSVLKQKSSGPNEVEASRELRQKYEAECLELKAELKSTRERLASLLAEHQELTGEHERLMERHDQLMVDAKDTQDRLTKKLQEEETRHHTHSQEQADLVAQLRQEMHSMAAAFKDQLQSLRTSSQRVAEGLREELSTAHAQISRLQHEADAQVLARAAASEGGGVRMLHLQEGRSSREGIEQQSELESVSSFPATPVSLSREDSQLSLEHLLSSVPDSGVDHTPSEKLSTGEVKMRQQLKAAAKKMDHLTELLHESEASSLRLGEQTKLLKEEIRRLERNQQREESVANMEYLKNVVLKFLQGKSEERTNLIPVITRLLQLSPQEVAYVEQTLKGNAAEIPTAASDLAAHSSAARKGWAGYMQRWTGY